MQIILILQVIFGLTIQPYLLYKLKGNLKIFVLMEYFALFGISVVELCRVEFINKAYHAKKDDDYGEASFAYLYKTTLINTIERHCVFTRKGTLALIVNDFHQLVSHPLEFKEYSAWKNQLRRGILMFLVITFLLLFNYVKGLLLFLSFDIDYVIFMKAGWWMYQNEWHEGWITPSIFYAGIMIILSRSLYHMVSKKKEFDTQQATNQAKVCPLILATVIFSVIIVSSFLIELITALREEIIKGDMKDLIYDAEVIWLIRQCHEGVCGFVVMLSFFFLFPRLRPSWKSKAK